MHMRGNLRSVLLLELSSAARLTSQSSGAVFTGTCHHAQRLHGTQSHLLMLVDKHPAELQHSPRLLILMSVPNWHYYKAAEFFRGGA